MRAGSVDTNSTGDEHVVRESGDGAAQDAGDESVTHLSKETQFAGVEDERTVLNQVRDALARIEDGSSVPAWWMAGRSNRHGWRPFRGLPTA